MSPQRIQLRRSKGWKKPANTVVVSRPTKWGNPITHPELPDDVNRLVSAYEYRAALTQDTRLMMPCPPPLPYTIDDVRVELEGKDLACWCPLSGPCHADVLLEIANPEQLQAPS